MHIVDLIVVELIRSACADWLVDVAIDYVLGTVSAQPERPLSENAPLFERHDDELEASNNMENVLVFEEFLAASSEKASEFDSLLPTTDAVETWDIVVKEQENFFAETDPDETMAFYVFFKTCLVQFNRDPILIKVFLSIISHIIRPLLAAWQKDIVSSCLRKVVSLHHRDEVEVLRNGQDHNAKENLDDLDETAHL